MGHGQRWLIAALAGALGGCGSSSSTPPTQVGPELENSRGMPGMPGVGAGGASAAAPTTGTGRHGGTAAAGKPMPVLPPTGQVAAALYKATSCDDLLARIQDDLAAKVEMQADLMRKEPDQSLVGGWGIAEGVSRGAVGTAVAASPAPAVGARPPTMTQAPIAAPNGGVAASDSAKGGEGPTDFSQTNVQVKGVDEADIVKTDGQHIYLLHGNQLFVLDSWPAAMTSVTNQINIEGSAQEMFVDGGKAVVFSTIYDQGDLIPQPAASDAKDANAKIVRPVYFSAAFTKISVISTDGKRPKVLRELYIQGDYVSARRHDSTVRVVTRDGSRFPELNGGYIEYRDQWGRPYPQEDIDAQVDNWRDRTIRSIDNTTIADWLPVEKELKGGKVNTLPPRCDDFYSPAAGLAGGGVTNIVSFDLAHDDSEIGGAAVLGMADEVYANDSVLVLAHRDWRWDRMLIERERTVLHRFEITGPDTKYTASGSVPGTIIDQFSIDEKDGVIRVATTARFWQNFIPPLPAVAAAAAADDAQDPKPKSGEERKQTDTRVITLGVDGDALKRLGITPPLGADGESMQSSRFVDDTGYVVTFQRVDPLLVIDLKKPDQPTQIGKLSIPGFSEYMHPIDSGHLLTIGQDADAQGRTTGLMLQIFDVTNAAKPRRVQSFRFGPNGYSEASQNHKAFTFFKPTTAKGFDGLLAFPYVNYNQNFSSTLEVFEVSIASGFTQLGAVDHSQLLRAVCKPYQPQPIDAQIAFYPCIDPNVRRGLFIVGNDGDFVYSISNGGVIVNSLDDLMKAVATVSLPYPDLGEHVDAVARPMAAKNASMVPQTTAPGIALPPTAATPPAAPMPKPMP